MRERGDYDVLSAREREVMDLRVDGVTLKEAGALLHISLFTVASHQRRALFKLGVSSRAEARRVRARYLSRTIEQLA